MQANDLLTCEVGSRSQKSAGNESTTRAAPLINDVKWTQSTTKQVTLGRKKETTLKVELDFTPPSLPHPADYSLIASSNTTSNTPSSITSTNRSHTPGIVHSIHSKACFVSSCQSVQYGYCAPVVKITSTKSSEKGFDFEDPATELLLPPPPPTSGIAISKHHYHHQGKDLRSLSPLEKSSSGDLPKKLRGSAAFSLLAEEDRFIHLQELLTKFISKEKMKMQQNPQQHPQHPNRGRSQSPSSPSTPRKTVVHPVHSPWWMNQSESDEAYTYGAPVYGQTNQRRAVSLTSLNTFDSPGKSSDNSRSTTTRSRDTSPHSYWANQPSRQPAYSPSDFYIRGRSSHHHKLPQNVFLFYQQPKLLSDSPLIAIPDSRLSLAGNNKQQQQQQQSSDKQQQVSSKTSTHNNNNNKGIKTPPPPLKGNDKQTNLLQSSQRGVSVSPPSSPGVKDSSKMVFGLSDKSNKSRYVQMANNRLQGSPYIQYNLPPSFQQQQQYQYSRQGQQGQNPYYPYQQHLQQQPTLLPSPPSSHSSSPEPESAPAILVTTTIVSRDKSQRSATGNRSNSSTNANVVSNTTPDGKKTVKKSSTSTSSSPSIETGGGVGKRATSSNVVSGTKKAVTSDVELMQLTDDEKVQFILSSQESTATTQHDKRRGTTTTGQKGHQQKLTNQQQKTTKNDKEALELSKQQMKAQLKETSKENFLQQPRTSTASFKSPGPQPYGLTQQHRSHSCESLFNASNSKSLIDFKSYEAPQTIDYSSPFDFAKTRFINSFILSGLKAPDPYKSTPTQVLVSEAKNKFENKKSSTNSSVCTTPSTTPSTPPSSVVILSPSTQTPPELLRSPGSAPRVNFARESLSSTVKTPSRVNPVKPFLSRGSVAERVLLFEKCPEVRAQRKSVNSTSSNKDSSEKKGTKSVLYRHWRNGIIFDNKAPSPLVSEEVSLPPSLVPASTNEVSSKGATIRRVFSKTASTAGLDIPRFHFPCGRPYTSLDIEKAICKIKAEFDKLPGKCVQVKMDMSRITKACGLPLAWKEPLRQAFLASRSIPLDSTTAKITCDDFLDFWKKILSTCYDDASRFVHLLSRGQRKYLLPEDFIPMIQDIVECHPGLTFLKEASEFHSRYVHTVIARIFYCVNRSWSGKISIAELRKSNFLSIVALLDEEEDINQITEYFSYEHFYVIYCKFWELDKDHDLIIDKHDLSKHNDGAISIRMIDRIFSGAVTRGPVIKYGKMTYSEFVWFLISEEDKHHPRAIEYWFRCMDLDGDGFLSMYELEWFYSEQVRRLEAMGIEALPFNDTLCQMLDMIQPERKDKISLKDLKRCKMTPIFFDTFFNLEKYLDHEQKDPFASNRSDEDISDWDRFASEMYEILVAEESSAQQQHQQQSEPKK